MGVLRESDLGGGAPGGVCVSEATAQVALSLVPPTTDDGAGTTLDLSTELASVAEAR